MFAVNFICGSLFLQIAGKIAKNWTRTNFVPHRRINLSSVGITLSFDRTCHREYSFFFKLTSVKIFSSSRKSSKPTCDVASLHNSAAIKLLVEGGSSPTTNRALLFLFCLLVPRAESCACRFTEVMPPFSSVMAFLDDSRLSLTPWSFRARVSFLTAVRLQEKPLYDTCLDWFAWKNFICYWSWWISGWCLFRSLESFRYSQSFHLIW